MSPDPPREDSGEDENRLRRFSGEFMEGMINDDEFFIIAPDAPYEMDMEEESEYSDSDDDGANGGREASTSQVSSRGQASSLPQQRVELVEGSEGDVLLEGQSRGRYRLLIPFPPSIIVEDSPENGTSGTSSSAQSITSDNQAHSSGSNNNTPQVEVHGSSNDHSQQAITNQATDAATSCDEASSTSESADNSKREFDLTEEKVEKIKEVMKSITLPPASIPKWVSEVDEDAWKRKLSDSITSKVSKPDKR